MEIFKLDYNNGEHLGVFADLEKERTEPLSEVIDRCYMSTEHKINEFIEENSSDDNMEEDSTLESDVNQAVIADMVHPPSIVEIFLDELKKESIVKFDVDTYTTKL